MKKQEYAEVEVRLAAAVSELPDGAGDRKTAAEALWEQPVEKASGGEWYLDGTALQSKRQTGFPVRRLLSTAAAAAAVLIFITFYYINLRTDAVVFLDVNPSVSLEINSREKVTQAVACNPDGEAILAEMDLRRTDVDVAVNALIGSMIRHGYLSEMQDTLLLSIDCTNVEKKEGLRQRLSGEINEELLALIGKSSVFEQDVDVDDALEDLAGQYGITPGKAALIMKLIEKDPSLDFAKLAGMPMNTLSDYLRDAGIDLRDYTRHLGDDDYDDMDDDIDDDDPDDDHRIVPGAGQNGSDAPVTPAADGNSRTGSGNRPETSLGNHSASQKNSSSGSVDQDDADDRDDIDLDDDSRPDSEWDDDNDRGDDNDRDDDNDRGDDNDRDDDDDPDEDYDDD